MDNMKKFFIKTSGILFLVLAVFYLTNSLSGMTGFVVFDGINDGFSPFIAAWFLIAGVTLLLASQGKKNKK